MRTRRTTRSRPTPAPRPEEILTWPDALVQALAFRTLDLMAQGQTRSQAALQAYQELRGRAA